MTPEEMIERFGPVDETVEAADGFEGPELFNPAMWLEGDDDEDEAFSDCGHVYLSRNFRGSGDPAVLISNTLLAAPKLVEVLEQILNAWELEMRESPNPFTGVKDANAIYARSLDARSAARTLLFEIKGT